MDEGRRYQPFNETRGSQQPSLYEVLGIDQDATPDEIKKAYRDGAFNHHPDRNPDDPNATIKFQKISDAYQILSDKKKRARYDRGSDFSGVRTSRSSEEYSNRSKPDYSHKPQYNESWQPEPDFPNKQEKNGTSGGYKDEKTETFSEMYKNLKRKEGITSVLISGLSSFHRWAEEAKTKGFNDSDLNDIIRSKEMQDTVISRISNRVAVLFRIEDHKEIVDEIKGWRDLGVNTDEILVLQDFKDAVQSGIMRCMENSLHDRQSVVSDIYKKLSQKWADVGVDVSYVLQTKDFRSILDKGCDNEWLYTGYGSDVYDTSNFFRFVENWKQAGIDVSQVINSDHSQEVLSNRAADILYRSQNDGSKFIDFVRSWEAAGWKPAEETWEKWKEVDKDRREKNEE